MSPKWGIKDQTLYEMRAYTEMWPHCQSSFSCVRGVCLSLLRKHKEIIPLDVYPPKRISAIGRSRGTRFERNLTPPYSGLLRFGSTNT